VRDQGDEVLNDDAMETGTDTDPEADYQDARQRNTLLATDYLDGRLRDHVNIQR
jgi:hypothetical protein